MGLFEDLSSFLELRLDEFLKENPHLELQALEDKLQDQEDEAVRLLASVLMRMPNQATPKEPPMPTSEKPRIRATSEACMCCTQPK